MNLVESIKAFFKAKSENKETGPAPEGVCPNCWGRQEWEGNFYKEIKAKNLTPETDPYNNFIKEIVTHYIDGIKIEKDTYTCETCHVHYKDEK